MHGEPHYLRFVNRRRFLQTIGAALAAGLTSSACAADAKYDAAALARPELLDALGAGVVRAIGARYRETTPGERDADALRRAILSSRPWAARLRWRRSPSVAELVRGDFADGRTVVVDGWVLAATEARQCALFSLLPG
ncbi:MAG: hypothetical protein ACJ8AO_22565 [Gemmatimonadaceae bacterium]